jgi:hypothetical protein
LGKALVELLQVEEALEGVMVDLELLVALMAVVVEKQMVVLVR